MKRLLAFFLLFAFVLGMLVSCNDNENEDSTSDASGADIPSADEEAPNDGGAIQGADGAVFSTKDIVGITFYAYYGTGTGSKVPAERMQEYITWLGSFTVGEKAEEVLPPGINTYYVEIEYLDGSIVKEGLDAIELEGTLYHLKHAAYPDSFMDVISQTSID